MKCHTLISHSTHPADVDKLQVLLLVLSCKALFLCCRHVGLQCTQQNRPHVLLDIDFHSLQEPADGSRWETCHGQARSTVHVHGISMQALISTHPLSHCIQQHSEFMEGHAAIVSARVPPLAERDNWLSSAVFAKEGKIESYLPTQHEAS